MKKTMKKLITLITITLSVCLILNCATYSKFVLNINSLSRNSESKKVMLMSKNKNFDLDSLENIDNVRFIKNGLVLKGFKVVKNVKEAEMVVLVDFGISAPIKTKRVVVDKHKTVVGYDIYYTTRKIGIYYDSIKRMWVDRYQTNARKNPKYHVVYSNREVEDVYFRRFLKLQAFNYQKGKIKGKEVWKVDIASTGSSSNLTEILAIMIAGSYRHFGEHFRKQTVEIKANHKMIAEIKAQ